MDSPTSPSLPDDAPGALKSCTYSGSQGFIGVPEGAPTVSSSGQSMLYVRYIVIWGDVGFTFSWIRSVKNDICPSNKQICGDMCFAFIFSFITVTVFQICCNFLFLL